MTWLQRKVSKRDEILEAVAAFRFELETNLGWLVDVLDTLNYLRDEAWVLMKNKGYVSYLPRPIPLKVIKVYDELHKLNGHIWTIREPTDSATSSPDRKEIEASIKQLRAGIQDLIELLDSKFPRIARNFRKSCNPSADC